MSIEKAKQDFENRVYHKTNKKPKMKTPKKIAKAKRKAQRKARFHNRRK